MCFYFYIYPAFNSLNNTNWKNIPEFYILDLNICSKIYDPRDFLLIEHKVTDKNELLQQS